MIQPLMQFFRGDNLKARVAKGATWTIGGILTSQFLRLVSNLILTRLLFPEAFGMMALVQVFITGLAMFSDLGIQASIIQNDRSNEPRFLNTAWTLQILRGAALWLFACSIALPVAWLYEEPLLAMLLPVAGLTALISGFTPTRVATANRDLLLGRITAIELVSQATSIVIMIALAWALQSVWALVIGSVLGALVKQTLLIFAMPGHRNHLQIDRSALGELVHFGKWIFLSTAFGFLINHADRAILGKFISLEMLGTYSIGFFLASVPLLLSRPLNRKIIFPIYKKRPPWESAENQKKIARMRWLLTLGLMMISAVLIISGNWLVQFLYDPRYALAGPILVLLAISQLPIIIFNAYGSLFLAAGDSRRYMERITATALIQTPVMLFGAMHYGVLGAIAAPGIAAALVYPLLARSAIAYKGYDALHDAVFSALMLLIATLGIWINFDAISALFHSMI